MAPVEPERPVEIRTPPRPERDRSPSPLPRLLTEAARRAFRRKRSVATADGEVIISESDDSHAYGDDEGAEDGSEFDLTEEESGPDSEVEGETLQVITGTRT